MILFDTKLNGFTYCYLTWVILLSNIIYRQLCGFKLLIIIILMKCSFFQATVVSILLYGCTTWTLTKRMEKKLDGNYTRMLRAILYKSWGQQPIHCWRTRDELISDVLLWTPSYGRAKLGRPARTYIQQLCEDTGCCPEDLPEALNDREKWWERVRDIRAGSTTWWCWSSSLVNDWTVLFAP